MSDTAHIHPLVRVPPPLLFLAAYLVGFALQRAYPISLVPPAQADIALLVGDFLLGLGATVAVGCLLSFWRARTTLAPHRRPARLLVSGPYHFSRNPMYVSLVVVYVGAVLVTRETWPLLLLPLPVAVMQQIVIPIEEESMAATFGESFEEYCSRVRRWL